MTFPDAFYALLALQYSQAPKAFDDILIYVYEPVSLKQVFTTASSYCLLQVRADVMFDVDLVYWVRVEKLAKG